MKTALFSVELCVCSAAAQSYERPYCVFGEKFSSAYKIGVTETGIIKRSDNRQLNFRGPAFVVVTGGTNIYKFGKYYIPTNENYSRSKTMPWVKFSYLDHVFRVKNVYDFSIFDAPGVAPFWEGFECRIHDACSISSQTSSVLQDFIDINPCDIVPTEGVITKYKSVHSEFHATIQKELDR